ncbi:hypothetical protein GCM10009854_08250 [Saccharopolyspora halophila]|uniref:Uncharacterized protein n=1 Tax=Saccharopolyspora halophila TaxID=405551 RepID=A0ABN3FQ73_9PSEU
MLRTTAAAVLAAAAATALAVPATAAPQPVQVHLGEVKCQDLSSTVAMVPELQEAFQDAAHTPVVGYRITAGPDAPMTEYQFKVNGEVKGSGAVGAEGLVSSSTSIPNNKQVLVEVTSGDKVLATRTYHPTC